MKDVPLDGDQQNYMNLLLCTMCSLDHSNRAELLFDSLLLSYGTLM